MKNPFIYNSPVIGKDFFNREKTLKKIISEVLVGKTQGDVWVTGERKTGKTSLLKYIHEDYKKNIPKTVKIYGSVKELEPVFAFANVQYCRTEDEFFNEMWQSLKNEQDLKFFIPDNPQKNFTNAVKQTYQNGFYIVFLIDEFDAFLETVAIENAKNIRNFVNKFNSILNHFSGFNRKIFSCIFTSNQDFIELNQKYQLKITGSGIIAQSYDLLWFLKKDMKLLTDKYLTKNSNISFTLKELDTLYKYTQGYPYFTQRILHFMFEYKLENDKGKIDDKIIGEFAKKEYEKTIKFWAGQNMTNRTQTKLNELLKGLGKNLFDTALKILVEYSKSKF
ncbi:MAG: hypothetical protein JXR68_06810 [Bacteroidales bacterium]|nr:hypothetical protein [Bacteroidales bacterium]